MGISAFMKQNVNRVEVIDYVASKDIINEETGEPEVWKLKALTNKEIDRLSEKHTTIVRDPRTGAKRSEYLDQLGLVEEMILEALVYPSKADLENADLQDSWGTMDPLDTLKAMLSPGEWGALAQRVNDLCGYEEIKMDELVEEAKKN